MSFRLDFTGFNYEVVMYRPAGGYQGEGEIPSVRRQGGWGYYLYD